MKKAIYFIGLAFALLLAAASCQKAPFLTFNGQKSFTFKDTGGSETITFSCNRAWTAKSSESWLTVSPAQGDANEEGVRVTITCAANTTYDPRNATVTIMSEGLSETISVSQETNYGLIVSPTTFNLTNAEQDIDIEVQKNVQYSVAIDKDCSDWISLGGTKALTTDKVTIHIAANTSYDDREGRITFKRIDGDLSQTVTVKQSQTNGLFITTSEYNLSNESHNLTVEVKANVEFEVTSQAEWIKFVETKALKASTISLSIDANESYDNRTGTVIVKQTNGDLTGTITINQHQTDGLFVSPTEFELDNTEQSVDIVVEQNVAYNVVIPDDAKTWIAVAGSSQTKALSKETVTLNIAKNTTYDDREASVTIKQIDGTLAETVKIKQDHSEGLIVDKTDYIIGWGGETIEVIINANVEYEVNTQADWIHLVQTKALVSSSIALSIDKNSGEDRKGEVSISKKDGSMAVTIAITQIGIYVDMGLSVKWGTCNVGAVKPEEPGGFYQWGGTADVTSTNYYLYWNNCPYHTGEDDRFGWTKYVPINQSSFWSGNGEPDNKTTLDTEDDIAYISFDEGWHIPTEIEWTELYNNCNWSWVNNYQGTGVNGYIVTSKKSGYTDKSIFLSASGCRWFDRHDSIGTHGYYWASSLYEKMSPAAGGMLWFGSDFYPYYYGHPRHAGCSIRPVYK